MTSWRKFPTTKLPPRRQCVWRLFRLPRQRFALTARNSAAGARRRGKLRPRVLYWFRTPPHVRVGREPFDDALRPALEAQNPGVRFDWNKFRNTPIPPVQPDYWRERRLAERAARQQQDAEEPDQDEVQGVPETAPAIPPPAAASGEPRRLSRRRRRRRGGNRTAGLRAENAAVSDRTDPAQPGSSSSDVPQASRSINSDD